MKRTGKNIICKFCEKKKYIKLSHINPNGNFCSYECYWKSKIGQVPWNKNKKMDKYPQCGFRKGHKSFWTKKTKKKMSLARSGKNNYNWKDKNVSYFAIHQWLSKNYGKANKCENSNCKGISNNYEWALLKNKKYKRKRENFLMLCVSCHRKYDITDKSKKNMSEAQKGRKLSEEHKKKISISKTGVKLSKEHRKKIKESWKIRKLKTTI